MRYCKRNLITFIFAQIFIVNQVVYGLGINTQLPQLNSFSLMQQQMQKEKPFKQKSNSIINPIKDIKEKAEQQITQYRSHWLNKYYENIKNIIFTPYLLYTNPSSALILLEEKCDQIFVSKQIELKKDLELEFQSQDKDQEEIERLQTEISEIETTRWILWVMAITLNPSAKLRYKLFTWSSFILTNMLSKFSSNSKTSQTVGPYIYFLMGIIRDCNTWGNIAKQGSAKYNGAELRKEYDQILKEYEFLEVNPDILLGDGNEVSLDQRAQVWKNDYVNFVREWGISPFWNNDPVEQETGIKVATQKFKESQEPWYSKTTSKIKKSFNQTYNWLWPKKQEELDEQSLIQKLTTFELPKGLGLSIAAVGALVGSPALMSFGVLDLPGVRAGSSSSGQPFPVFESSDDDSSEVIPGGLYVGHKFNIPINPQKIAGYNLMAELEDGSPLPSFMDFHGYFKPKIVSQLSDAPGRSMVIKDSLICQACSSADIYATDLMLRLLNMNNDLSFDVLGTFNMSAHTPNSVAVSDDLKYAYVGASSSSVAKNMGVYQFNIKDPSNIFLAESYSTIPDNTFGVKAKNGLVYSATQKFRPEAFGGIGIFSDRDISQPLSRIQGSFFDVDVSDDGRYLFTTGYDSLISIYDLSNATYPELLSSSSSRGTLPTTLINEGNRLYHGLGGVTLYDVTKLYKPEVICSQGFSKELGSSLEGMEIWDGFIYAGSKTGLNILSAGKFPTCSIVDTMHLDGETRGVAVKPPYVYVSTTNSLYAIGSKNTRNFVLEGFPQIGDQGRYSINIKNEKGDVVQNVVVSVLNRSPERIVEFVPAREYAVVGHDYNFDLGHFFRDPDGDKLTYIVDGLPGGFTCDQELREIKASSVNSRTGTYKIKVTADDGFSGKAYLEFELKVINSGTETFVASVGEDFSIDLDEYLFGINQVGNYEYLVQGLPPNFYYDEYTNSIKGTGLRVYKNYFKVSICAYNKITKKQEQVFSIPMFVVNSKNAHDPALEIKVKEKETISQEISSDTLRHRIGNGKGIFEFKLLSKEGSELPDFLSYTAGPPVLVSKPRKEERTRGKTYFFSEDKVYIPGEKNIRVFDLSQGKAVPFVKHDVEGYSVFKKDNALFASGINKISIYDATNPCCLNIINSLEVNEKISDFTVKDNYLYVISTSSEYPEKSGFTIFDISNYYDIKQVGHLTIKTPSRFTISDKMAAVHDQKEQCLHFFDISDKSSIKEISKMEFKTSANFEFLKNGNLITTDSFKKSIFIIDPSTSESPKFIERYDFAKNDDGIYIQGIRLEGDVLYLTAVESVVDPFTTAMSEKSTLARIDITDSNKLSLRDSFSYIGFQFRASDILIRNNIYGIGEWEYSSSSGGSFLAVDFGRTFGYLNETFQKKEKGEYDLILRANDGYGEFDIPIKVTVGPKDGFFNVTFKTLKSPWVVVPITLGTTLGFVICCTASYYGKNKIKKAPKPRSLKDKSDVFRDVVKRRVKKGDSLLKDFEKDFVDEEFAVGRLTEGDDEILYEPEYREDSQASEAGMEMHNLAYSTESESLDSESLDSESSFLMATSKLFKKETVEGKIKEKTSEQLIINNNEFSNKIKEELIIIGAKVGITNQDRLAKNKVEEKQIILDEDVLKYFKQSSSIIIGNEYYQLEMKTQKLYKNWKQDKAVEQKLEADSLIRVLKEVNLELLKIFKQELSDYLDYLELEVENGQEQIKDFRKMLELIKKVEQDKQGQNFLSKLEVSEDKYLLDQLDEICQKEIDTNNETPLSMVFDETISVLISA